MSERLTDEQIDRDAEAARLDGNYMALNYIAHVSTLRAAALTEEEVECLGYLSRFVSRMLEVGILEREARALGAVAILAKLTGAR